MYRSVITHTKDATHKKTTVASGLKAALFGIGFSLNISRTVQTDESLVKDMSLIHIFQCAIESFQCIAETLLQSIITNSL